ncbi:hypothetical protein FSP39_011512 [Pinctada imbricata]|uniref:CARD domain-containing protein n=1 Tax=Pinctada imbricata TaxID=66713 RepID=A0AA89C2D2_PINIB|nr:hypothetical protein FSP39_011512 [Pinctada imbricata]
MDAESRQRIQKCYTSLLDLDCTPADLLGSLVEKQVLDFDDQERILAEITSKDKAEKFISILITKENSYKPFREVLKKAHEFIGERLDAVEIDYDLIKKGKQIKRAIYFYYLFLSIQLS